MMDLATAAQRLLPAVAELRNGATAREEAFDEHMASIAPERRQSVRNLLHYLALSENNLRPLQQELAALGLNPLASPQAVTMASLNALLIVLRSLAQQPLSEDEDVAPPVDFQTGPLLLEQHSHAVLGRPAGKRSIRMVVTAPSEAATDPSLVRAMLAGGMDIMRINCAQDDVAAWLAMIDHCRRAQAELGRPCLVYADLAGPSLCSGPLAPQGQLRKLQPKRNIRGQVLELAQCWIVADDGRTPGDDNVLLAPPEFFARIRLNDLIRFKDAGGRKRTFAIRGRVDGAWKAETNQTCYLEAGLPCHLERDGEKLASGRFGALLELVLPIRLRIGDQLVLTRQPLLGQAATYTDKGRLQQPAHIHCTLAGAFGAVMPGERILFAGGKIAGIIADTDDEEIHVTVTQTPVEGGRLREGMRIHLPDSAIAVPALTPKDMDALEALHAKIDIVGMSHTCTAGDVASLYAHLRRLQAENSAIMLKVDNVQAYDNLGNLLLASHERPAVAVLVERSELAGEVGIERLAELEERILRLCEAAHAPLIWGPQVLEGMAKNGQPARAELSGPVVAGRAAGVLLDKAEPVVPAVQFLNGTLERMSGRQAKQWAALPAPALSAPA